MTEQKFDLSITIVSFNTLELTRQCLQSIFENTKRISFEVWVVDNNSSDGSVDMIQREFPQVNLIINNENKGLAAATNQGLA
ncbi:MAG: glycosyltransferase, partial [Armatimonadota bacterium]|nr:glycosyltransferase [Armatimonadota bacterium]